VFVEEHANTTKTSLRKEEIKSAFRRAFKSKTKTTHLKTRKCRGELTQDIVLNTLSPPCLKYDL